MNFLNVNQPEFVLITAPLLGVLTVVYTIIRSDRLEREEKNEIRYIPICKK